MKIIIIVNEFRPGPGGVGTHAYELAKNLFTIGHSVDVVCAQNYASTEEKAVFNKAQKFRIHPYSNTGNLIKKFVSRFLLFRNIVRSSGADIVLASGSNAVWIAAFYRVYLRTFKLVVIAHGGELTFRSFLRRHLTLWGCRIADHIISVSHYTKQYLPSSVIAKTTVIYNGANSFAAALDREALRAQYGFSGKRILLTIGSVSERKGQDIVIKALKNIMEVYPDVLYLMAGRSNTLSYFVDLVNSLGLKEHALFLGSVTDEKLAELFCMTDLFVLASRHSSDGDFEGFGIAVIEAALCGVPAIVTKDSGLVEAIEEGRTGFSIPTEDSIALASMVIKVLDDEEKLILIGNQARDRAEHLFTWKKIVREYENVLSKL